MATCDNDHEPITFEGEFRALCPLCAMREQMKKDREEEVNYYKRESAEWQSVYIERGKQVNEAEEKLDKMEEERDALKAESDSLLGALKGLKAGGCWCEAGIDNPMMAGRHSEACEAAKDAIHEAERRRKN